MEMVEKEISRNEADRRTSYSLLNEDLKKKVEEVAGSRGESFSVFVRRSVLKELADLNLAYLSADEKKALGLEEK
ncbi:hypothetical protein AKJ41_00545 [candidate division MSBL1 archaeon SCGC-AAA259O05]|uniref:Uncharacterized protein n=1 Tax=candidate division MSBL1 archaeon SCGC-AAA259O05 TaxID=1698271 RepID=A0A133V5G1_9EURY|nr:hypothetical protein AKJ41_00545 [candidate division MSBL1 archaeon SCGC-AAA259O05]